MDEPGDEAVMTTVGIQTSRCSTPLPLIDNGLVDEQIKSHQMENHNPIKEVHFSRSKSFRNNQRATKMTKAHKKIHSSTENLAGKTSNSNELHSVEPKFSLSQSMDSMLLTSRKMTTPVSRPMSSVTTNKADEVSMNNLNIQKNQDKENTTEKLPSLDNNLHQECDNKSKPLGSSREFSVPIIKVKQDAVFNRGVRKLHGIAELNSMRNKNISFDPFRLSKRMNKQLDKKGDSLANQMSLDDANGTLLAGTLSVHGRGTSSDVSKFSQKSSESPSHSRKALARSKTFSVHLSKSSATPSTAKDFLDEEQDDLSIYKIKGNGLQKEGLLSMNHNTPLPLEEFLTSHSVDKTKPPNLARYNDDLENNTSPGLVVDQINGTAGVMKCKPKRFKPKKDNSKVVLKYYADGMTNGKALNGTHVNGQPVSISNDTSASATNYTSNSAANIHETDKMVKIQVNDSSNITVKISNKSVPRSSKVGQVSLTTKNLELFDEISHVHEKLEQRILYEEQEAINERVLGWINETQKEIQSGNGYILEDENNSDFSQRTLFSTHAHLNQGVTVYHHF